MPTIAGVLLDTKVFLLSAVQYTTVNSQYGLNRLVLIITRLGSTSTPYYSASMATWPLRKNVWTRVVSTEASLADEPPL